MTMSDFAWQISLSNTYCKPSKPHKSNPKYLMNEHCRMHGTMDIVEEEEDNEEMEAKIMTSSSTLPTQALAQLAAKLKQIMGTNTSQVPMSIDKETVDMDTKDPKKWAQAPTPIAGLQATVSKTTQIRPPEGKKPGMMEPHPAKPTHRMQP